jgi:outer membrane protein assembly factor BamB
MIAGRIVVVTSGFPTKRSFGLRLGAPAERVAWKFEKGTAYVPTGIVYRDLLYLLTDSGILTCLDPLTGKPVYEGKRLPAPARFFASPVAAGGRLYLTSEEGDTFVIKAGPEHQVLATNSIGEPVTASMAIAGDSFYLRTAGHLFRIRQPK